MSFRRTLLVIPCVGLLGLSALPAAAATPAPSPSPTSAAPPLDPAAAAAALQQAKDQLRQAQSTAQTNDNALTAAQHDLAAIQAAIAGLEQQARELDAVIASDDRRVGVLTATLSADRVALASYVRSAYERDGSDNGLAYLVAGGNLSEMLNRGAQVGQISGDAKALLDRIRYAQDEARSALADASSKRATLLAVQQRTATERALLAIQLERVQSADAVAHQVVQNAQTGVTAANDAVAAAAAAEKAAAARRALLYVPIPGVTFGVDTDLTLPSGETADRLNGLLLGSPLQGLGGAYLAAEQKYHVSARYLLAHSIEESAFGASAIARDKHNLFGYGAHNAHPYTDALSFPGFPECIDFVAGMVANHYLTPTGPYYHGPTLRGMNVNYATDPNWANNIARIASSFA